MTERRLTPEEEQQIECLNRWLRKIGLASNEKVEIKRYDASGNLVAIGDRRCKPRLTTFVEDRQRHTKAGKNDN